MTKKLLLFKVCEANLEAVHEVFDEIIQSAYFEHQIAVNISRIKADFEAVLEAFHKTDLEAVHEAFEIIRRVYLERQVAANFSCIEADFEAVLEAFHETDLEAVHQVFEIIQSAYFEHQVAANFSLIEADF